MVLESENAKKMPECGNTFYKNTLFNRAQNYCFKGSISQFVFNHIIDFTYVKKWVPLFMYLLFFLLI